VSPARSWGQSALDALKPTTVQTRFISLRTRLLALLAFVLIPSLGLLWYTQAEERGAAIENVNRDAARLIRIATSNQAAHIEAARQLLTAFAQFRQLRPANAAACSAFLSEMLRAMPLYSNFGVVDPDGNLRCSAVPLSARINVADRAYFRKSSATRGFAVGDYIVGRVTRQPSITYAYPLLTAEGDVEGIARTFDRDLGASPELKQALLHRRNANWSRWIEQRMAQPGAIMVAVGAGHLAGGDSVIAMLRRDGYRVHRLQ